MGEQVGRAPRRGRVLAWPRLWRLWGEPEPGSRWTTPKGGACWVWYVEGQPGARVVTWTSKLDTDPDPVWRWQWPENREALTLFRARWIWMRRDSR